MLAHRLQPAKKIQKLPVCFGLSCRLGVLYEKFVLRPSRLMSPNVSSPQEGFSAPHSLNITLNVCRQFAPTPMRSTSTALEKNCRMRSVVGWNSSAGETSSSRGGSLRSWVPGKYPCELNSFRSTCHFTRIQ